MKYPPLTATQMEFLTYIVDYKKKKLASSDFVLVKIVLKNGYYRNYYTASVLNQLRTKYISDYQSFKKQLRKITTQPNV